MIKINLLPQEEQKKAAPVGMMPILIGHLPVAVDDEPQHGHTLDPVAPHLGGIARCDAIGRDRHFVEFLGIERLGSDRARGSRWLARNSPPDA